MNFEESNNIINFEDLQDQNNNESPFPFLFDNNYESEGPFYQTYLNNPILTEVNENMNLIEENALYNSNFLNIEQETVRTINQEAWSTQANTNNTNTNVNKRKEKIFKILKKKNKNKIGLEAKGKTHTKFDFDNAVRKIKSNLFDVIKNYLNISLQEEEENNKMMSQEKQRKRKIPFYKKGFLKLEKEITFNTNVELNLALLNSSLRDIFSRKVCLKVTKNYGLDHNKYLIEQLKANGQNKRTNEILDMTFLQCLEHVRGSNYYESLKGLEDMFENVINQMKEKETEEYIENLRGHLSQFEVLYGQKKPRKSKKNNNVN